MTVLGKTLVVVNLVFSVVVGALIVMVYATRTNWQIEYNKLKQRVRRRQRDAPGRSDDQARSTAISSDARVTQVGDEYKKQLSEKILFDQTAGAGCPGQESD